MLRSRVRTTGIVRSDFKINRVSFTMFDVGGQRNERRKVSPNTLTRSLALSLTLTLTLALTLTLTLTLT